MRFDPALALSYASTSLPYLAALLLGVLVPMLGVLCYYNFWAGVAVIAGMYAIEALVMTVGAISLGISIYYTDMALVFVCGVALLRLLCVGSRPRLARSWVVYCIVVTVSLVTGLATYGSAAGVQARGYFGFTVVALYGMSFAIDESKLRVVFNALVGLVVLLLGIVVYRWIVYYTPITSLLPPEGAYNVDGPIRVIRSYEALLLAQLLVISLFFVRGASGLWWVRALSPAMFTAVLVLQHRSVWTTAIAGIVASLALRRLQRATASGQLALLLVLAAGTAIPIAVSESLSGVGAQITSSADNAFEKRGSAGERLSSWAEILKNWAAAGPRSVLIGQSFGTDPTRFVHDDLGGLRRIDYTAHNMYVQTLFNTGLLGLGGFVVAAGYVVSGLYRLCASGRAGPEATALLVLILMQLVYYIPYGTDYLQSLIFGAALSFVAVQERRRADEAGAGTAPTTKAASGWGLA